MHNQPNFELENSLPADVLPIGIDEVGRGAWAGPVVTAAVILPPDISFPIQLFDSKKLTAKKRNLLSLFIKHHALYWQIGSACNQSIDTIGISNATKIAMVQTVQRFTNKEKIHLLIDAVKIAALPDIPKTAIIKGDSISASIAAASILAKEYRDALMKGLPNASVYGFNKHVGYGTKLHREMIYKYGLSEIHRQSFISEKYLQR